MGDFERVKEACSLKAYAEANLEKVRGGYVCPTCKSGTGPNKSPAFSIKGETWKCFSCDAGGDIFDLAAAVHGLDHDDRRAQLQAVAQWAHIPTGEATDKPRGFKAVAQSEAWRNAWKDDGGEAQEANKGEAQGTDYTEGRKRAAAYLMESRANLNNPDAVSYLKGRGISLGQARAWGFGYDPEAGGAKDASGNWCRRGRIVMPWKGAPWYYVARSIAPDVKSGKYHKPSTEEVGPQPLYNPEALSGVGIPVVVEGVLDALAVEECGFPAVALGGTSHREAFTAITSRGYDGPIVLLFDNDKTGEKAAGEAEPEARRKGLFPYRANLGKFTECKDAFEVYTQDVNALKTALAYFREAARDAAAKEAQDAADKAGDTLNEQDPAQIAAAIFARQGEKEPTPTGFHELDRAINGGLRDGLTILGAVSSAGKTTLLNQIADYIAAHGRPVLFVSCEQSARELVSKSLSRMMAQRGYRDVTQWEMSGKYRDNWPDDKTEALLQAVEEYSDNVAPNLTIMQADEQPTVEAIKAKAAAIEAEKGQPPCIFVDYLQLLAPKNERATDKQRVDENLSDLRRLARRMPIVGISSLNRNSYTDAIAMESFKESGGVEYSSDVLLGLQPRNMWARVNSPTSNGKIPTDNQRAYIGKNIIEEFRKQPTKEAELTVLKNRNGRLPEKAIPLKFRGASSLFTEGK